MLICQLEIHIELTVTMDEDDLMYVCGLSISPTEDDPLSKYVSDGNKACLFDIIN